MSFLDLVRRRRSVRRFAPRPLPRVVLERCLEAARLAPSACNSQPWLFIVVDDPAQTRALGGAAFTGLYAMNKFAIEAPALVVAVRETSRFAALVGGWVRGVNYSLIDLGIACEHLVLQAAEEGIGTCWLGWFNARAVRRHLGLPWRTRVDIVIALGYPEPEDRPQRGRKPAAEVWQFFPR